MGQILAFPMRPRAIPPVLANSSRPVPEAKPILDQLWTCRSEIIRALCIGAIEKAEAALSAANEIAATPMAEVSEKARVANLHGFIASISLREIQAAKAARLEAREMADPA
jgi:hypothetical protein